MERVLSNIQVFKIVGLSEIINSQLSLFKTMAKAGVGLENTFKCITGILTLE